MSAPTPAALGALAKIVEGFPLADFLAILNGTATVDTDLDLAEQVVGLVAIAFPPGASAAGEVGIALQALKFLLDAAGTGGSPVTGGQPDIIGEENAFNEKDR